MRWVRREPEQHAEQHAVGADEASIHTHNIDLRAELGLPVALERLLDHDWSSIATQFSEAVAKGADHSHHEDGKVTNASNDGVASAPEA